MGLGRTVSTYLSHESPHALPKSLWRWWGEGLPSPWSQLVGHRDSGEARVQLAQNFAADGAAWGEGDGVGTLVQGWAGSPSARATQD